MLFNLNLQSWLFHIANSEKILLPSHNALLLRWEDHSIFSAPNQSQDLVYVNVKLKGLNEEHCPMMISYGDVIELVVKIRRHCGNCETLNKAY